MMDEPKRYRDKVVGTANSKSKAKELRRSLTPPECRLWLAIKANKLDGLHFRKQVAIGPYIADFYCHSARFVVEVDGSQHNTEAEHDRKRNEWMNAQGICVLRFSATDVRDHLDGIVMRIRAVSKSQHERREHAKAPTKTPSAPPAAGHLPRKPGGGEAMNHE